MRRFTGRHIDQQPFEWQLRRAGPGGVTVHIIGNEKLFIFLCADGDHFDFKPAGIQSDGHAAIIFTQHLDTAADAARARIIACRQAAVFLTVGDAVAICVGVKGIQPALVFFKIGQPVAVMVQVGIVEPGAQPVGDLPVIGQAVGIPVDTDRPVLGVLAVDIDVFQFVVIQAAHRHPRIDKVVGGSLTLPRAC